MSTQKIAVIGSGISGLGSAFILSGKHRVYLFEKEKKFGGHSNTITINKEDQQFKVDTGFIVYNDNNYPNFSKLLSHLKEITIVDFDHNDVVRHPLVSKIVRAYSKND